MQVDHQYQDYFGVVEAVAAEGDAHCAALCFARWGRGMVVRPGVGGELLGVMEVADRGPRVTAVWATPHQELAA